MRNPRPSSPTLLLALVLSASCAAAAGARAIPDSEAAAWFPVGVREAGIIEAHRADLAPGIEYGYACCSSLFANTNDMHVVRIAVSNANVRPFIAEGAFMEELRDRISTTAASAAKHKALFATNGGFFRWENRIPFYRMKLHGEILKSEAGGDFGLAFSEDGAKVFVGRVPKTALDEWENFFAGEGFVIGGKVRIGGKVSETAREKPEAPRTMFGMDADGSHLLLFVTGGRYAGTHRPAGLSYREGAELLAMFGCESGANIDGGGSSTLAVRADALPDAVISPDAHPSATPGYVILNCPSDGSERAVLDHLLFLER